MVGRMQSKSNSDTNHVQDVNQSNSNRRTSRICIKHMPKSLLDETKLKNHLFHSRQSYFPQISLTITDCKVLEKRRIAFVGFSTVDAAAACVQYLHRSYYRTTQLIVEFALPPKEIHAKEQPKKKTTSNQDINDEEDSDCDSELIHKEQNLKSEAKKNEFLEAMGALSDKQSHSRVWSNDDGFVDTTTKQKSQDVKTPPDQSPDDSDSSSDTDKDDADPLGKGAAVAPAKNDSDFDFLRSKTVAVHDLDDASSNLIEGEKSDVSNDKITDEHDDEDDEEVPMKHEDEPDFDNGQDISEDSTNENENTCPTRLFIRNIAFDTSEEDLKDFFSSYGTVEECHIPVDDQRKGKGFGFVSFDSPGNATAARAALDGTDFQGRLIHILPARQARSNQNATEDKTKLSYKEQLERGRRGKSMDDQSSWSASHLRGDAVVDNLAARLGLQKGAILPVKDGMSGGDAAVRLALAETAIIEENRKYFADHGIDMEALVSFSTKDDGTSKARSQTCILVKNLPHDTTTDELSKTFGSHGPDPSRILLPPSRTVAVVEFGHAHEAKRAFKRLAYRRFKTVPLYLEWAPLASLGQPREPMKNVIETDDGVDTLDEPLGPTTTIFVKNLNFSTTEEELQSAFGQYAVDIRTVRIPRKVAPVKRTSQEMDGNTCANQPFMSMGYGFVEFKSHRSASIVVKALQGKMVGGHSLELQIAKGSAQRTTSRIPSRPACKIMARNVPFQATRKDLLQLFGSFGHLKKVRLPKKFDGNHRGFAFIEFVSGKEAAAAMNALSRTHLYGRHLVLEWAEKSDESVQAPAETTENHFRENKKIRFDE